MKKLAFAAAALPVFVAAVSLKSTGYHILGASPPPQSAWLVDIQTVLIGAMYYLLTLGGIAAGVVFDALAVGDQNTQLSLRQVAGNLRTARSWRGLVASPLIFLTVYMGVGSNPVTVPFILLAFQNGFFWRSVMSRLLGQQ